MADKAIGQLNAATAVQSVDLFVLEQNGEAKKLTGQILENWLVSFADGHGGIQTIAKTSSSGTNPVVDTYTITLSDETEYTFDVTNGVKGDTGAQTYVWIKYSAEYPDADSDMGDSPDDYIGVYVGLSSSAPTHYTDYMWFKWKGETGQTGAASTITSQSVTYQEGQSGTVAPSGSWTPNVPTVTQGNYLWTKTELNFNDGTTVTAYSVTRMGVDGTGSVSSVNNVSPDGNGNVAITANDIPMSDNQSIQTHVADAETDIADLETSISNVRKRKFILIGDSFGSGVDGDNSTQTVTGGGWIDRFTANCGFTVYSNPSPLTGLFGFASSRPFLDVLQNIETVVTDKDSITDIVVLGGTNDLGINESTVIAKIEEFIAYAKTAFPNARIAIGCIGTNVSGLVTLYRNCYSKCTAYGAEAIHDTMGLMCIRKYIGTDGTHLKATGYAFYQEFINQAILNGTSTWKFTEDLIGETTFTVNTSAIPNSSPTRMTYNITNNSFAVGVVGSNPPIANLLPYDSNLTTDATIGSQNIFTPILRYIVFQNAGARTELNLYFDNAQNIIVQRPYKMAADFNPFGAGGILSLAY